MIEVRDYSGLVYVGKDTSEEEVVYILRNVVSRDLRVIRVSVSEFDRDLIDLGYNVSEAQNKLPFKKPQLDDLVERQTQLDKINRLYDEICAYDRAGS